MHLASALGVLEELIFVWDGKFGRRDYSLMGKFVSDVCLKYFYGKFFDKYNFFWPKNFDERKDQTVAITAA